MVFDARRGKGSHGTLVLGDRRKELKAGALRAMCPRLGIDVDDL